MDGRPRRIRLRFHARLGDEQRQGENLPAGRERGRISGSSPPARTPAPSPPTPSRSTESSRSCSSRSPLPLPPMSIETFSPLPLTRSAPGSRCSIPRTCRRECRPISPTWNFFPGECARARASSRNSPPLAGHAANQRPENLQHHESGAAAAGARFARQSLQGNFARARLSHHRPRASRRISYLASTTHFGREYMALLATAWSARICRASMTIRFSIASARSARRRSGGRGFRRSGNHFAGRASVRGGVRHAPGILDRAFAAGFLDGGGRLESERHEYSHRPVERGAAPARVHRRGRREFLSRARHDGDQRQHHHFARRGFQRHDSAFRRQHGLSFQPDRAARAAWRGAITPSGFSGGASAPKWTTGATSRSMADGTRRGNGRPLGWQLDATFGAGGSRESTDVVWGDAYRITADGVDGRARPDHAECHHRRGRQSAAA